MSDQDTEPSIEEILKSIRQIISDDDDQDEGVEDIVEEPVVESAEPSEPEPPEPEPEKSEEDVIDLVEKVEEPVEDIPEPEPEPIEEPVEEIVEDAPEPVEVVEPEMASEPEILEQPEPVNTIEDTDDILSGAAEAAALDAFAVLAKRSAVESDGITVEEIVRTELRPLLKRWLDGHLPTIIERLVQEELERVAKRAMEE